MSKITKATIFVGITGFIIGAVVEKKFLEKKNEERLQDEIDSIRETFGKKRVFSEEKDDVYESVNKKMNMPLYKSNLKKNGYTYYSNKEENHESKEVKDIFVVDADDFEDGDYEKISLTYYSDGILADDQDQIVNNIEATIGVDALNHFFESSEDIVYVRNDVREVDYEITRDLRTYSDVTGEKPYLYSSDVEE